MELRPLFFGGRGSSETIQCKESRRTHTREKERKTSSTGRQRKSCIDPRKGCKHNNRTVAGTSTSHKGVDWPYPYLRGTHRILPRNHRRHRSATAQSSRYRSDSGAP